MKHLILISIAEEYKELVCDVRTGIPFWRKNFNEAVSESKVELRHMWDKCAPTPLHRKFLVTSGLVSVVSLVGASIAAFGIEVTAIQGLGFIGFTIGILANRLKYNRHILAIVPVSAGLVVVHMALLGGWSYAVMGLIAGSRAFVLSTLGDGNEYVRKRLLTGFGFYAVGLPTMLLLTFHTPWSLLTALAMTCGTVADVMTSNEKTGDDNSRFARVIRMGANISNAVFYIIE